MMLITSSPSLLSITTILATCQLLSLQPALALPARTNNNAAAKQAAAQQAAQQKAAQQAAQQAAAAAAAAQGNCVVTLPPNPLTAQGLATPWVVSGAGCTQTANGMPTFAECTIIDTATGALSVYSPLLINANQAHITPVPVQLTATSVVGCWFGTNGVTTTLAGDIANGKCVNGIAPNNNFVQFAACNAVAFFAAANAANIQVPPIGMGNNGLPCPTTRSFELIDMDPSDNVITAYLVTANGMIAQKNAANAAQLQAKNNNQPPTELNNGSDNLLLSNFVGPALGCADMKAMNLADPANQISSLALNELQAAAMQAAPIALVPPTDPFVLSNNQPNLQKQNLYRAQVNQPASTNPTMDTQFFCQNMLDVTGPSIFMNAKFYINGASPAPATANNLLNFMGQRYMTSWTGLGCQNVIQVQYLNMNMKVPIIANVVNGVATSLTANTAKLKQIQMNAGAVASGSTSSAKTTSSASKTSSSATKAATSSANNSNTSASNSKTSAKNANSSNTKAAAATSNSNNNAMTSAAANAGQATSAAAAQPTSAANNNNNKVAQIIASVSNEIQADIAKVKASIQNAEASVQNAQAATATAANFGAAAANNNNPILASIQAEIQADIAKVKAQVQSAEAALQAKLAAAQNNNNAGAAAQASPSAMPAMAAAAPAVPTTDPAAAVAAIAAAQNAQGQVPANFVQFVYGP